MSDMSQESLLNPNLGRRMVVGRALEALELLVYGSSGPPDGWQSELREASSRLQPRSHAPEERVALMRATSASPGASEFRSHERRLVDLADTLRAIANEEVTDRPSLVKAVDDLESVYDDIEASSVPTSRDIAQLA